MNVHKNARRGASTPGASEGFTTATRRRDAVRGAHSVTAATSAEISSPVVEAASSSSFGRSSPLRSEGG